MGYGTAWWRGGGTPGFGGALTDWQKAQPALRDFIAANYNQPNPHSRGAMVSPPTIATATTLANFPTIKDFTDPAVVASTFLIEGGNPTIAASVFEKPAHATQSASTTVYVASRVSATVNADAVAFYVIGTTLPYRFLVDDQYVDLTGTVPAATTGTGGNYITLTFASKAVRKVTIELQQGQAVRRFLLKSGDTFGTKPTAKTKRGIVFGDSITAATGATHFGDGYVAVAGDTLGTFDLWPSGVGSTGYVNTNGATRYKLSERLATDLAYATALGTVDFVVVAMGINDLGLSGIQAEAETCLATIRAAVPGAQVFVVGPWDSAAPSAPAANYATAKAAIQAAVTARGAGITFLDPEGTSYTKADAVHPDTAGHATLGAWLALQIKTALNA